MNNRFIALEQAIQLIRQRISALPPVTMPLDALDGETMAEDILSPIDQPPFPRSPLDGYAVRGEDCADASAENPVRLPVVGKVCAGEWFDGEVQSGQAVRIMTGAPIPEGANAVIRQEDTDYGADRVSLYRAVRPWQNYCYQGEDFKAGDVLLTKGTRLDAAAIAVLASCGRAEVLVHRKPTVAVISTGDELTMPGEPLGNGQIYNSNLYLMRSLLRKWGISCTAEHGTDNASVICEQIIQALTTADAVITTGGVSVGERDILNEVLPILGAECLFEGLDFKPGSPAKLALLNGKPILALSGNPFAAAATAELLARPVLGALMGTDGMDCVRMTARLAADFGKASPRRRFVRGTWSNGEVMLSGKNSSGQLFSMLGCNCLVDIPAGTESLRQGDEVSILLT